MDMIWSKMQDLAFRMLKMTTMRCVCQLTVTRTDHPSLYIILGILSVITSHCLFQSIIYNYIPLVSLYIFYNITVVSLEDELYEGHPVRLCFLAVCCSQQNIKHVPLLVPAFWSSNTTLVGISIIMKAITSR